MPLIDLSVLKSRTLRLLLLSSSLSSPALAAPIVLLSTGSPSYISLLKLVSPEAERRGHSPNEVVFLYTSIGLGWILGCSAFGLLVVRCIIVNSDLLYMFYTEGRVPNAA